MQRALLTTTLALLIGLIPCARATPLRCDGDAVLARAARAYQAPTGFAARSQLAVNIPGAPVHNETTEFGASGTRIVIRMPRQFVMDVQPDALRLLEDTTQRRVFLRRPASADLQQAVDEAFEGHGAPLVPVPLLLRSAADDRARIQAFRNRLLHTLTLTGCTMSQNASHESLAFKADNGRVTATFDAATGRLVSYKGELASSHDGPPLAVRVEFTSLPGSAATLLPESAFAGLTRVGHFEELTGATRLTGDALLASASLRTLAGDPLALDSKTSALVIDFWARWCAPCRLMLPQIVRFANEARARRIPVRVLLVNTEEKFRSISQARAAISEYLSALKLPVDSAVDLDARFHRRFGGGLPLTVLFANGAIVERYSGLDEDLGKKLAKRIGALPATAGAR